VFATFLLLMAGCVGLSFWQEKIIRDKEAKKQQLVQHLEQYNLRVDKNLILKLVEQIRQKNRSDQAIGNKFLNLAVISEVVDLTPPNVRLLEITTRLGPMPTKKGPAEKETAKKKPAKGKNKKVEKAPPRILILEGIVQGDRLMLESALAAYLLELKNSRLFDQPNINSKSFEFSGNNEVLRFKAQLNLI
jgi:hypothetical protein